MIVLHAAALTWGKIDGIGAAVPALIRAQHGMEGLRVALLHTGASRQPAPELGFSVFPRRGILGHPTRLVLPAPFDRPDLVVFHNTYIPFHAALARRLRRLGIPYVICPHGGMTRAAQRQKWFKKRLGNLLFFNRFVAHAQALHCLTPGEAAESDHWRRPTFVVGNGIALPDASELASPGRSAQLAIAYVGRLDMHHKGLDWLVDACGLVRAELRQRGACVQLRGPDVRRTAAKLQQRIADHQLQETVRILGPVVGDQKALLLRHSDVFLHTSRWEGHPMAVLEALAYGLPCLLTPGTNLAETVANAGAGWRVEPTPAGIAEGLRHVLRAAPCALQQAGRDARRLAEREFRWQQVAARVVEHYRRYVQDVDRPRRQAAA